MKVDRDDYMQEEFDVENSVPHVTLWVSEEYEQKQIGQMMLEAEEAVFIPLKENHAIWRSEDQRFIKLMITAQGQGQPQTVRMTHESICSAKEDFDPKREEMLREVPECLWSQHSTDIGLVKSAQPVRVELRQGVKLPWKSQLRDYYRLLEQEDVTLVRCVTVNPAENLPTSEDGEPHDCVQEAERYSKLRSDLQALPLCEPDLEFWTDGSCYRVGDTLSAGYAVVKAQGEDFVVVKAGEVSQPASA
ncbi:hypothetical protein MHYP_G00246330 [Metynnis hypsauchen]